MREIVAFEFASDQTDLLTVVSLKPTETISGCASKLKGRVSKLLRQELRLKDPQRLLSRGYFACTVGNSTREDVERYLNDQGSHHRYDQRVRPPVYVQTYDLGDDDLMRVSPSHAVVIARFHIVLVTAKRRGVLGSREGEAVAARKIGEKVGPEFNKSLDEQLAQLNQGWLRMLSPQLRQTHWLPDRVNASTTHDALQVAVTLALALANQRITLEKVQAVNETTDRLIGETAKNLRTQGAEIHKMAAGTTLNIETLKQSFADIRAALDDVSRFRQEALLQMAQAIVELDKLSVEAGKAIQTLDNARKVGAMLEKNLGQSN